MAKGIITPELTAKAQKLSLSGKSTRQISGELLISKTLVARLVSAGKPRIFKSIHDKGFTDEQIVEMYQNQKLNTTQIEGKIGVSHETIRELLHQYGAFRQAGKKNKMVQRISQRKPHTSSSHGYTMIYQPQNHKASAKGYVYEHLLVWEQVHNKPLPKGWVIHHVNGVKTDNRPENLLAMPRYKHEIYIPILKQRIRELEAKVKLLEKALDEGQMIFNLSEN